MAEKPGERRLQRSRQRVVGGVCGGLAAYFGWPARTMRWGYAALTVLGVVLPGLIVYLVLWLALPMADDVPDDPAAAAR